MCVSWTCGATAAAAAANRLQRAASTPHVAATCTADEVLRSAYDALQGHTHLAVTAHPHAFATNTWRVGHTTVS